MILEGVRMICDGLRHATDGVNAVLPSIPVEAGDERPPKVKAVMSHIEDNVLARNQLPADFPVLLVSQWAPTEEAGEVRTSANVRDGDRLPIAIGYMRRDVADSAQAVRETLYTLRAIKRSIRLLMDNGREADRTRNAIQLIAIAEMFSDEVDEQQLFFDDGGAITGIVRLTCFMRDVLA